MIVIALFSISGFVNAQIGVDLDDLAKEATAAKIQWSKDVDMDSVFPKHEGLLYENSGFNEYNLLGDTVILTREIKRYKKLSNSERERFRIDTALQKDYENRFDCIYPFRNDEVSDVMPAGSYVISGYVFFKENRDSLRKMLNLPIPNYNNSYEVESMDDAKAKIMHGQKMSLLEGYCAYIKFSGIDSSNNQCVVYAESPTGEWWRALDYNGLLNRIVFKKYYDLVSSTFLNKKVFCLSSEGEHRANLTGTDRWTEKSLKTVIDAVTGKEIILKDTSFFCKKVIVTKDVKFLLLMEGEHTGSFAMEIANLSSGYLWRHMYSESRRYPAKWNGFYDLFGGYYFFDDCLYAMATYKELGNIVIIPQDNYENVLERLEQIKKNNKNEYQEKKQKYQQKIQQERLEKKRQIIAKYGAEMGQLINNGNIRIGMDKVMCKEAWGTPWNTYKSTTAFGTSEVWVYNYKTRVYFLNNKIVKIEE